MSETFTDIALILNRLDDLARMVQGAHGSPWLTVRETALVAGYGLDADFHYIKL